MPAQFVYVNFHVVVGTSKLQTLDNPRSPPSLQAPSTSSHAKAKPSFVWTDELKQFVVNKMEEEKSDRKVSQSARCWLQQQDKASCGMNATVVKKMTKAMTDSKSNACFNCVM